jgi:hypothetical protein
MVLEFENGLVSGTMQCKIMIYEFHNVTDIDTQLIVCKHKIVSITLHTPNDNTSLRTSHIHNTLKIPEVANKPIEWKKWGFPDCVHQP